MKFNLKFMRRLNILIAGGLSGMYFISNAYYLENIKKKLELKIGSAPAPVSPKIKNLVRNVMDDMALDSEERSLIQVFIVNDFNLKHLGYPNTKFGVFLGVPQHFVLDRHSKFEVLPMIENTQLSPDSPEAWNFKHVLSLSEEAKKFAVASEIYEAKHESFYFLGLLPSIVLLQGNVISLLGEKWSKISRGILPLFNGLVFIAVMGFYIFLNDITNIYTQAEAEYHAAELGNAYIDGGIEYYEKVLERNKVIKKLNKNAPYTEKGELKKYMGFRTHSMPLERRIKLLKDFKRSNKFSKEKQNPLKYVL